MKGVGVGRCHGAITVVNAIATGKGAAVGIDLTTEAEVKVMESGHLIVDIASEEREPTALVRACLQRAFNAAACDHLGAWVSTRSEIPASRGLKSSSAAANAVILAALDAVDKLDEHTDDSILRMGVEGAITASVTITGAFDDACACYYGGLCLTDNGARELLQRQEVDDALVAVLHIPKHRLAKRDLAGTKWEQAEDAAAEAFRLAEKGHWMEALKLNGSAYARLLGHSEEPARIAIEAGALTAGLTGTGPATAAVCEAKQVKKVGKALRKLAKDEAVVVQANLTNQQAEVVRRPSP